MSTVPQHSTQRTPSLRGTIDEASLGTISTVVRLIAGQHLDELAERTGGLVAGDQPSLRVAIESAVDAAIREAWDRSRHTEPRRRDRPERNTFDSPAAERAS